MNLVVITGRQTAEAKINYTQDGKCIARFNLAVDRKGEGTDFPSCVAFGKTGEFIEKYGAKGKKWNVEGRLQTGSYEKDGHKVYTTDVIINSVEFGESKSNESAQPTADIKDIDDFMKIDDSAFEEELPFV